MNSNIIQSEQNFSDAVNGTYCSACAYVKWISLISLFIIYVIIIFLNLFFLFIFLVTKELKHFYNLFVLSLALNDLLFSLLNFTKLFYIENYLLVELTTLTLRYINYYSILLISLERWLHIVMPLVYKKLYRKRIFVILLLISYITALMMSIPCLISHITYKNCQAYLFPSLHVIILIVLFIIYCQIFSSLQLHYTNTANIRRHLSAIKRNKMKHKSIKFILVVCFVNVGLLTPYCFSTAFTYLYVNLNQETVLAVLLIRKFSDAFVHLSNFLVYIWKCPYFTKTIKVKYYELKSLCFNQVSDDIQNRTIRNQDRQTHF
ncbi:chemokine XC receptor 1-like [Biomphalaria glabrata]|uniref:Chemokine XC receptor 1-like n=1 Tax=Biomphalaria glabrata TaxID=6526 RepID=A0A9W2YCM1_BIOGL|nr:chemokine XC receptor 1-like [Biomphalaria glabrata]